LFSYVVQYMYGINIVPLCPFMRRYFKWSIYVDNLLFGERDKVLFHKRYDSIVILPLCPGWVSKNWMNRELVLEGYHVQTKQMSITALHLLTILHIGYMQIHSNAKLSHFLRELKNTEYSKLDRRNGKNWLQKSSYFKRSSEITDWII